MEQNTGVTQLTPRPASAELWLTGQNTAVYLAEAPPSVR
jgi:hypothetical protein